MYSPGVCRGGVTVGGQKASRVQRGRTSPRRQAENAALGVQRRSHRVVQSDISSGAGRGRDGGQTRHAPSVVRVGRRLRLAGLRGVRGQVGAAGRVAGVLRARVRGQTRAGRHRHHRTGVRVTLQGVPHKTF